jgi:preprotein translocase subunit YajC
MWLEGIAWAQAASGAAGPPQTMIEQILYSPMVPLALVIGVIYFLLIRPQNKKASDHRKMLEGLKRNDEVITAGGLIGRIAELGEKVVTIEIAPGTRVRVERPQIASLSPYAKATKKEKGD